MAAASNKGAGDLADPRQQFGPRKCSWNSTLKNLLGCRRPFRGSLGLRVSLFADTSHLPVTVQATA